MQRGIDIITTETTSERVGHVAQEVHHSIPRPQRVDENEKRDICAGGSHSRKGDERLLTTRVTDRLAVVTAPPLRSCDGPAVIAGQLGVSGWTVLVRGGIVVVTRSLLQRGVKRKWRTGVPALYGRQGCGGGKRRRVVVPGVIGGRRCVYVTVVL